MAISTAAFDDASDGGSKSTFSPSRNPNIGVQYGTNYEGIIRNQAIGGEVYTVERYGKRRSWSMTYTFLSAADQVKLQALIDLGQDKQIAKNADAINELTCKSHFNLIQIQI